MLSVGPMAKGRRKRAQGPEQLAKQAVRSLVRGKRCKPKGWDDNMDWKFEFPITNIVADGLNLLLHNGVQGLTGTYEGYDTPKSKTENS